MAKPWSKLQQNFINHPKFLALTANAIGLWLEGKNYCDMHQTDGLIPTVALQTFRFAGRKSIALLQASAGAKPDESGNYAPLWAPHPVGFKMHDYLDYNDCRELVLERIEQADEGRERKKQNQQAARDRKRHQSVTGDAAVTGR